MGSKPFPFDNCIYLCIIEWHIIGILLDAKWNTETNSNQYFNIYINSPASVSCTHFFSECKKKESLTILPKTFDCSIDIYILTILRHTVNEQPKESWLGRVLMTVYIMFRRYSSRSYPGVISFFHLTKSSPRSRRTTNSVTMYLRHYQTLSTRINKHLSEELQIHHRTGRNVLPH